MSSALSPLPSVDTNHLFNPSVATKPFTCFFSFLNFFDIDIVRGVNKAWGMQCRSWQHLNLENPLKALSARGVDGCAFITPNEIGMENTFKCLTQMQKIKKGVHIGVSALHNWDFTVAMRSSLTILLDHSWLACRFNVKALEILRSSSTREVFKDRLLEELGVDSYGYTNNFLYEDTNPKENALRELTLWMEQPYSALHNAVQYNYIRTLAQNQRIIVICASINDCSKMKQISEIVHGLGLRISSLYLSNIYDYFRGDEINESSPREQETFKKSVSYLKEEGTCIIDSTAYSEKSGIAQQIVYGRGYTPAGERTKSTELL